MAGAIGYVSFFLISLCLSVSVSLSGCSLRESAEFNIAVVVASLVVGDQLPRVISCEYPWLAINLYLLVTIANGAPLQVWLRDVTNGLQIACNNYVSLGN